MKLLIGAEPCANEEASIVADHIGGLIFVGIVGVISVSLLDRFEKGLAT